MLIKLKDLYRLKFHLVNCLFGHKYNVNYSFLGLLFLVVPLLLATDFTLKSVGYDVVDIYFQDIVSEDYGFFEK